MSSNRTQPIDAIIVGAMKAGSTSLAVGLAEHPGIILSSTKEPRYFSLKERARQGLGWYESLFEGEQPGQLRLEASTCYSRWPHFGEVMPRIASVAPDIKLIYILRHPIERAYSHYRHEMRRGVTMSFREALDEMPEIHAACDYRLQVERIHRSFPSSQLYVMLLDDLQRDQSGSLSGVFRFLGLGSSHSSVGTRVVNAAGSVAARDASEAATRRLGQLLGSRHLKRLFPRVFWDRARSAAVWAASRSVVAQRAREAHLAKIEPMTSEERLELAERYRPVVSWVESYLHRDLPEWYR